MEKAWTLIKKNYMKDFEGETRLMVFEFLKVKKPAGNCKLYFLQGKEKMNELEKYDLLDEYNQDKHTAILILIPEGEVGRGIKGSLKLYNNSCEYIGCFKEKTIEEKRCLTKRCRTLQS